MPHARTQIRQALVTRLTGLASTGSHVQGKRYYEFDDSQLPALRIYAENEDKQGEYMGGRQQRNTTFIVEAVAKQNATIDDTLDQVALEVEAAIAADQTLGGLVKGGVLYVGIDDFRVDDSLEKPAGIWPIRFAVNYDVDAKTPQTIA